MRQEQLGPDAEDDEWLEAGVQRWLMSEARR
jgi:hypothetical protein